MAWPNENHPLVVDDIFAGIRWPPRWWAPSNHQSKLRFLKTAGFSSAPEGQPSKLNFTYVETDAYLRTATTAGSGSSAGCNGRVEANTMRQWKKQKYDIDAK